MAASAPQPQRRRSRGPVLLLLLILVGVPGVVMIYQTHRSGLTPAQLLRRTWSHLRGGQTGLEHAAPTTPRVAPKIDFLRPVPIGAPSSAPPQISHLQAVDLDQDGLLDVVVCDARDQQVTWIRQHPRGTFTEHVLAEDLRAPAHVQAIDFDQDGDRDLLVAVLGMLFPNNDKIGAIVILENTGDMTFVKHVVAENIARVSDVRGGDLDGDGDLDLVVAQFGYDDGETRWVENLGNWTFRSHILQTLSGGINAELADLDKDGDLDIVLLISQEWEEIYVFLNDGRGNFTPKLIYGSANEDFGSSGMSLCDFDQDGDLDILYTNGDAFDYIPMRPRPWHGVQWLENQGDLQFVFHRLVDFPGAYSARALDVDHDGDLDLFAVSIFNFWENPDAQSLIWLENDGRMQFRRRDLANAPTSLITLDTGDFDGDGETDLVTGGMHLSPPFDRMGRVTLWRNQWASVGGQPTATATAEPVAPGLPHLPDLRDQPVALARHLRAVDRAARQSPTTAAVVGRLGLAYHANTFADQARQCYARAQELAPADWRWKYYAALLAEEYGHNAAVIEHLRAVVALNPEFALAWLRLGQAEFKQDNVAAAESAYRQAIATDHPSPGDREPGDRSFAVSIYAAYELARAALDQGRPDTARAILEELARRRPDFGPGQRLLGRVETQLGNSAAADQARARANALKPYVPPPDPLVDELVRESHSSSFLLKQADLAYRVGRFRWNEELCRRAIAVGDNDPDALVRLARVLKETGRLPEAVDLYRQVLRLNPDQAEAHYQLAIALEQAGQTAEAIRHYETTLELDPRAADTHGNLGIALARMGQLPRAIEHFQEALRLQPNRVESHNNLGNALLLQGRAAEAIRHFQAALHINPHLAVTERNLANALQQTGDVAGAITHFERALQINPEDATAHFQLGQVLAGANRSAEASRHFEEARRLDPNVGRDPAALPNPLP